MPIRINLLAEAQAEEEMRRKDPVKRAFIGAVVVVALVMTWCGMRQVKIIAAKSQVKKLAAQWAELEPAYTDAVAAQRELMDAELKLAKLEMLRTNRFLWGNALDAVQRTIVGVKNIQVVRLSSEQSYTIQEGAPARTNETMRIPARPAKSVEKISISLEAVDFNEQPGSQVTKFKESILAVPYFEQNLQKTNAVLLTSLSPPQTEGGEGRPFVKFTLQCFFPEEVR